MISANFFVGSKRDKGSSLVEVLIATFVFILAGIVLIGGFYISNLISHRNQAKSAAVGTLEQLSQKYLVLPFHDCADGAFPYEIQNLTTPILPLPTIQNPPEIQINGANGWEDCVAAKSTSGVQRLVLTAIPNGQAPTQAITKVVLKVRG